MRGQNHNCHKNKIRTNKPKIWKNNKNLEAQPKLSGSYKKSAIQHSVVFRQTFIS